MSTVMPTNALCFAPQNTDAHATDISIVVCTHNRAAMLRGALASLYDLVTDGFTYEVVVIDNGSTDETQKTIATAAGESQHPLRGVYEAEKGIVPARNRGIREARGRWIAFFDDDQLADSRWLVELHRGAMMKQCRVVGGSVHLTFPHSCTRRLDPTVRMLLGEARHGDQPLPYSGRLTPGCGNFMIQRPVFDEVGVFHSQRTRRRYRSVFPHRASGNRRVVFAAGHRASPDSARAPENRIPIEPGLSHG